MDVLAGMRARAMFQLVLAFFIIGTGLSVAGMGTHLYQGLSRQPASLGWEGANPIEGIGRLAMSFVCGPYILLQMGFRPHAGGAVSAVNVLLAAIIAFGWSFITGLMIVGTYVALVIA